MNEHHRFCTEWLSALVTAVARLNAEQLIALAESLEVAGQTTPSSGQLQRALSVTTGDAGHLARSLAQVLNAQGVTAREVQTALATLAHARNVQLAKAETVEFACTAPNRLGVPLRTTYATALEMVQAARLEILAVGYVFTEGARPLLEQMAAAHRDRRVRVTLIGNRMEDHLQALRSSWPTDCPEPRVFSCDANPKDDMAALHAKLLISDGTAALVRSANFSHHGLHENIEIGVKIESPSVARLDEFFRSLIAAGHVREIEWDL